MIGRILEGVNEGETMVIITPDHGTTPTQGRTREDFKHFNVANILEERGLLKFREENGKREIDLSHSKAIPLLSVYIYVNHAGKFLSGCVEEKEYERVRDEVINTLYDYTDPKTGEKPVVFALRKKDARILDLYEELVGDIVYGIRAEYSGEHGRQITTDKFNTGSMKGLFIAYGPGIRKGYSLKRTVWLTDIVPTICYAADLPVPQQCEGTVIYQLFGDIDFKRKELETLLRNYQRLKDTLEVQKSFTHSYG